MAEGDPGGSWLITSPTSLLVDKGLVVLDGLAVLISFSLVFSDLVRQRPIDGLALLLVIGIPLLVGGQFWVILVARARGEGATGTFRERITTSMNNRGGQLSTIFGGLPRRAIYGVFILFGLGWLSAMTAFYSASNGGPAPPGTSHCQWPVSNHGVTTCVTHAAYLQAGAALQRFAAGILMGFFVVHLAVAVSETRRRSGGPDAFAHA
jgi:hypothetical protein